jgi:SAM-dependent methyltransferase
MSEPVVTPGPGPSPADKLAVYDRYAAEYEERTRDYTRFLEPDYQAFAAALPGPHVLDLGSGPGRDALALKARGLEPRCLDLSEEMLALCRAKGLETERQDIEQLKLDEESLDGVWSYTSLTTIPKEKVWQALREVRQALVPEGVLFLGLIEGQGEGWKPPSEKYDVRRYISRYREEEVLEELSDWDLLAKRRIDVAESGRNSYLHFLLRR